MQQSLSQQIQSLLDEYEQEVEEILQEEVPKVAKEASKRLKKDSPGKGNYHKGWTLRTEKGSAGGITTVIYNAKSPGLAHLLENGHALRGGGRSRPIVHIKPVEEWANEEIVKRIEEALR